MKHHELIVIGTGSSHFGIDSSMKEWGIGLIGQCKLGGTSRTDVRDRVCDPTDRHFGQNALLDAADAA